TEVAVLVVPEALACWSTAAAPDAVESPLYSRAVIAPSAADVNLAVIAGVVPAPEGIGAVQTLCSVWSGPVKWLTSVNASPAEAVTPLVVALAEFQTPTSTTSRLPLPSCAEGVTEILAAPAPCLLACCTNVGVVTADGVTELDAAEAGPAPTAFVAVTLKV